MNNDVIPGSAIGQAPPRNENEVDQAVRQRRAGTDRRTFGWRTIVYAWFKPRRQRAKRAADQSDHYVDFHPKSSAWLMAGIMILAAVDAALMLYSSELGIRQLNGYVATLMDAGRGAYVSLKLLGTCACLLLLASVSNLKVYGITARHLLHVAFFGYVLYILNLLRYF